jgi:hypothetical protein
MEEFGLAAGVGATDMPAVPVGVVGLARQQKYQAAADPPPTTTRQTMTMTTMTVVLVPHSG